MKTLPLLAATFVALAGADPAAAESVSNPVTGYEVSLYRPSGGDSDFQGWIMLLNGEKQAGYIYIQNGIPMEPRLGGSADERYVVIDIPVAMLGDTLTLLTAEKDVRIIFDDQDGKASPTAFLIVGSGKRMAREEGDFVAKTFGGSAASVTAAP